MTATTSLASLLLDHPAADDEPLLHSVDETLTAGEARRAAHQTADALRAAGVRPRQAVAVQLPNGPRAITTFVGVWLAGAVFVPVNPRFVPTEVDKVVATTQPAALVTGDGATPLFDPRRYDDGVALVLWTSGTTGAPKAILHTHTGYLELLDRVLAPLRRGAPSSGRPTPNLVPVSLALNAGLYNVLFGLRAGAEIVVMDRFDTATFAELVRRFAIRSTVLPPAAVAMLNDDAAVASLAPLKYVRAITAPLSPLQARRFGDRFGAIVLNGYGQAEIGEVIGWTAADARAHPDKLGAAGRPHPGVDVKLVDGVLHVRPPQRASGYASGESMGDRVDADGYVDTGDVARIDDDGFVWIEGRVGDVINRGGNKVFPGDVEEVLRLAAFVDDAAVVGAPDDRLGEVPVAFVAGDADRFDAAELERVCREHLVAYKVPVSFHHVAELPRSEVGKVLRSELVARLTGR